MGSVGSETLAAEDGDTDAVKQPAIVPSNANAMERNTKPAPEVTHCLAYSLARDLARVWEQYNKSHFRDEIAGLHRSSEFSERDLLRQPKHKS